MINKIAETSVQFVGDMLLFSFFLFSNS